MMLVKIFLDHRLPSTPSWLSQKILQLVNDPEYSAADIVAVVCHDQSITANVLRFCNSAYFGLKHRIDSLVEAIVLIGQNQLAELVMISSCIHGTDAVTLKTFLETAQLSEEFVDSCTQELGGEMEKAAALIGLA